MIYRVWGKIKKKYNGGAYFEALEKVFYRIINTCFDKNPKQNETKEF